MAARRFFGFVGFLVVAGSVCGSAVASETPNVIFVFADEHRYQSMSFTEQPDISTPVMARMASEGVFFRQAVSNYPVCSPFRAMVITGRWPYRTGVIDNNIPLSPDEFTIGDAFRAAGYVTGYIGKWHLGGTRAEPFGFDESLIWTNTNTHFDTSRYHPAEGPPVQPKGYNATLMMDQAIDFVERHREESFFLTVSLNPPHARFTDAPAEKMAMYPPGSLKIRQNTTLDEGDSGGGAFGTDEANYRGYHAHVSAVDDELGRLLAALEANGVAEQTIVVYSSDHGSMLGSHGVGSKRQPYEESLRIPFIVYAPGIVTAQSARDELIGSIDFMPTILGLAGIDAPASCEGRDFSPWVFGELGPRPDYQLIMHIAKGNSSQGDDHPAPLFRGIRTMKVTYAEGEDGPTHVFDNRPDPYQLINMIEDAAVLEQVPELHGILVREFGAIGDPFFEGQE